MAGKRSAATLPAGTLTILFTDIEGSTRLLQDLGRADYARLLSEHHRLVRSAIAACEGVEVKTEGDSFFAVFPRAADAITAAVQVQRSLAAHEWPGGSAVAVRAGVHTGDVAVSEQEYVGMDIHRAARISSAAHGGQVLVSDATRSMVEASLPADVSIRDLGEHRLKDIDQPEHLFQLVVDGLRSDFPPPRAASTRLQLLPAEISTFVGREAVIERAAGLLEGTRLLTLTGPGGTGKTRLAIRMARILGDHFADGVAFVPLTPVTDPELVAPTIRQALGLVEQADKSALDTIAARLNARDVLLVLDNLEQVLGAAPTIGRLLEATDSLKVIVTSRAALHISGEQEYPVPPLTLPSAVDARDLDALAQSEAVALFVQRARAVRPDFAVSADNARAIVEICARLDGLPLAIELAASRIKLLPPAALLARLGNRLDLLQSSASDRTDRQRTLRGTIDWSYDLLSADERAIFRRLAVFVGGWDLAAADVIGPAGGRTAIGTIDGLTALVDHSLVRQDELGGEPRFAMLETIREYGLEQLVAAGEHDAIAEAHARHFAALAAEAEPRLTAGREWPDRLETEHANIRAALAWLSEHDLQLALVTGGRLWRFWHLRGHLREGTHALSQLLAQPDAAQPTVARAKALIGLAGLVYWQVNYPLARSSYEEALGIAQEIGDRELEVEVFYSLAYVHAIERDWDGAIRDYRTAMELYESQGNALMAAWALESIGMATTLRGDHRTALPLLDEAIGRFEQLGDSFGIRNSEAVKSRALMQLGLIDESRELNRQVMELASSQQDITSLSAGLLDAASLAALAGDLERAARLTGAGQRIVDESGGQPPPELVNRIDALPVLQQSLTPDVLASLISEGRALSLEEAVALARHPGSPR